MSIAATNAARDWISASDPDPDHADVWLRAASVIILPLGYKWCAVKVPAVPGERAVQAGLAGPAILEPGRRVYFPVPLGTDETWDIPGTKCLGDGYLGVPGPKITQGPGIHWLSLPTGALVDPDELHAALTPPCP
ncbi:hypothetical protein ACFQ6V_07725 [Streptomyces roseifaciens]